MTTPPLGPGTPIGRYFVVEVLGAGDMGTVYAAYDPQLERRVALKLMRPGDQHARLIDEAKALAQINHPHVTAVYDAGLDRGQVFLTMELVDGDTLEAWLGAAPRSLDDIVEVMVAAGRGLAAAHAAGLVHRDFKPSNVLVAADGGVKVTDFASLGTPRYMAPERLRGEPGGAIADQFAFAVALSEAIHGVPPYAGDTPAELAVTYAAGRPPRSSERRVPARLAAAIARGLALDPADRFASLDDLLAALRSPPRTRALWLGAAIAAAAIAAVAVTQVRANAAAPMCGDASQEVTRAWNAGRAARVAVQFHTSDVRGADHVALHTIDALDHQAAELTAMYIASCRATRELRTQSDAVFDVRGACLDRSRAELAAFATLLEHADRDLVRDAFAESGALASVARCASIDVRDTDDQPAVQVRPIVGELDGEVGAARALLDTGRNGDAVTALERLAGRAEPLHYRPIESRIQLMLAKAYYNRDERDRSIAAATAAVYAALATHDDALLFDGCVNLGDFVIERDGPTASDPWLRCARAAIERLPDQPEARAELALLEAQTADRTGDTRASYAIQQRALAELDASPRPPLLAIADILTVVSREAIELGEPAVGIGYARRALAIEASQFGDDDFHTAAIRASLGTALASGAATAPEAIAQLDQARTTFEREFGAASERLGLIEQSLGDACDVLDRRDDAIAHYHRAIDLYRMDGKRSELSLGIALQDLGSALIRYRRFGEALTALDEAAPMVLAAYGPTHIAVAVGYFDRGQALDGVGQHEAAIAELERALPIFVQQRADAGTLGDAHHALALALAHVGRGARARAEMTAAAAAYAGAGPAGEQPRADAARWLVEHP